MAWFNAWTWQLTFGLMLVVIPLILPNWPAAVPVLASAAWTRSPAFRPSTIYLDWRSCRAGGSCCRMSEPAREWRSQQRSALEL